MKDCLVIRPPRPQFSKHASWLSSDALLGADSLRPQSPPCSPGITLAPNGQSNSSFDFQNQISFCSLPVCACARVPSIMKTEE